MGLKAVEMEPGISTRFEDDDDGDDDVDDDGGDDDDFDNVEEAAEISG